MTSQPSYPRKPRDMTRREAIGLGAATAALQFLPSMMPEMVAIHAHPEGVAADSVVNMALLNCITDEFAVELAEFNSKNLKVAFDKSTGIATVNQRRFKRLDAAIDYETGGKVISFQEINPKTGALLKDAPVRVLFPGLSDTEDARGELDRKLGAADRHNAHAIIEGKRSAQIPFIKNYIEKNLIPSLPDGASIELFAHSMGAPNALHAKHALEINPLTSRMDITTTLFEPIAAAGEAAAILADEKRYNPAIDDAALAKRLAHNVTTIRAQPATGEARLYMGNDVANMGFGDTYLLINHGYFGNSEIKGKAEGVGALAGTVAAGTLIKALMKSDRSDVKRDMSRRQFVSGVGAALATNLAAYAGGGIAKSNDSTYHDTAINARKLADEGDNALTPCTGRDVLPTLEQLRSPEKFRSTYSLRNFESKVAGWEKS